jgi:hypothetical protein
MGHQPLRVFGLDAADVTCANNIGGEKQSVFLGFLGRPCPALQSGPALRPPSKA